MEQVMSLELYQTYLEETIIPLRLAGRTASGWPIILSLWYLYEDDALYCATPASAKIIRYLENDARCAFEIASDLPPYCGIRGQAEAELLPQLGGEILERLLHRYLGGTDNALAQNLLKKRGAEIAIRLEPVKVSTWNFKERMQNSLERYKEKPCP